MTWRRYFGGAHAVCMLAVDHLATELERADVLLEGAAALWERGTREAHAELYARGADCFPFASYYVESLQVLELLSALRADVEQMRRDRSRSSRRAMRGNEMN